MSGHLVMLDKNFLDRIDRIGPPQRCEPLTPEQDMRLSAHLPESYMAFLRTFGFGDYWDRSLQYCDPEQFSSVLELVFREDADFSARDCFVVAYSAFGQLVCWSERHDHFEIDLVELHLTSDKLAPTKFAFPPHLAKLERSTDPNILARTLLPFDREDYEKFDVYNAPLLERCRQMYGDLERGECYGYFPESAAVGIKNLTWDIRKIRRVSAAEHFTDLAQIGEIHLMKRERGRYAPVRVIGAQVGSC